MHKMRLGKGSQSESESSDEAAQLSPLEEHRIVKQILNNQKKMKLGEVYYVINSKWLDMWKSYVRFDESNPTSFGERPDAIDNQVLLESEPEPEANTTKEPRSPESGGGSEGKPKDVQLRKGLAKFEYEIVPEEAWILLKRWYNGGPAIPRRVIGAKFIDFIVDLYPLTIRVISTSRGGGSTYMASETENPEFVFQFSRTMSMKQVRHWIGHYLFIPPHKANLLIVEGENTEIPIPDLSKTLEDLGIEDGHTIMFKTNTDTLGDVSNDYRRPPFSGSSAFMRREMNKEGVPPETGVVGLVNIGNTCFMNSVLQCLSSAGVLVDYFLNDAFTEEINSTNHLGTKGELATEFGALLKEMWCGKFIHVVPRNFKRVLSKFAPQFSGFQQQDSQELLATLLDGLHEDLNRVKSKHIDDGTENTEDLPEEVLAQAAWEKHLLRNNSFIVDLFQGQFKSTVVCDLCTKTSITFDPFMYLSLPIPTSKENIFEVVFFPLDGQPTKYGVRVPRMSEVRDLKASLAKLVGINPNQIHLTDIVNNRAFLLDDWKYTFTIRKTDLTVGYEVLAPIEGCSDTENLSQMQESQNADPMDVEFGSQGKSSQGKGSSAETDITNLQLLQRKTIPVTDTYTRTELFGMPLMLSYDKHSTTHSALRSLVMQKLQSFLGVEDAEVADKLNIRTVTNTGRYCGKCKSSDHCAGCDLPNDDSLVDLNPREHAVSVDWDFETARRIFSEEKTKNYILEDDSLRLTPEEDRAKTVHLSDCLKLFNKEEKLSEDNTWLCPTCKQHSKATKKLDIWKLPEILSVHLKRFSFSSVFRDKLNELVEFPEELEMAPFVLNQATAGGTKYELFGVSNHMGNLTNGHYTAFTKHPVSGKWYQISDNSYSEADSSKVVTNGAYLLFYRRVPAKSFEIVETWKVKAKERMAQEPEVPKPRKEAEDPDGGFSRKRDAFGQKREYDAEDKDRPSNKPRSHWSHQNDEDEDLLRAIELSKQTADPNYYQAENKMAIVPYAADDHPTPGDSMHSGSSPPPSQNRRADWKKDSGFFCDVCRRRVPGGYDDLEVHMLTDCPGASFNDTGDFVASAPTMPEQQEIQSVPQRQRPQASPIDMEDQEQPTRDYSHEYIN